VKNQNADFLTLRVLYRGSVYVGSASESDQTADITRGRLWAKSGCEQVQQVTPYSIKCVGKGLAVAVQAAGRDEFAALINRGNVLHDN
jgi:hypothetical protein